MFLLPFLRKSNPLEVDRENIIYSVRLSRATLQLMGCGVLILYFEYGKVVVKLSKLGLLCFLIWFSMYYYCAYKTFTEDETILRALYDTKLRNYGDLYELAASLSISSLNTWKLPFALCGDSRRFQDIADMDVALKNMGVKVNYKQQTVNITIGSIIQATFVGLRFTSIYGSLWKLDLPIPYYKLYVVVVNDAALACFTTHYCFHLIFLMYRLKLTNQVLESILSQEALECKFTGNSSNTPRCLDIQYNIICNRIKECSRIYDMAYRSVKFTNKMFGYGLAFTMLVMITFIILNLFYFMEATSAGLANDSARFFSFFIYIIWAVAYDMGVIMFIVVYSEATVDEAKQTSLVVHDIINAQIHPSVTDQATQMSLQLLHQVPKFTACGLYNLDYPLLLDIFGFVTTFLVLLLQYAAEGKED